MTFFHKIAPYYLTLTFVLHVMIYHRQNLPLSVNVNSNNFFQRKFVLSIFCYLPNVMCL